MEATKSGRGERPGHKEKNFFRSSRKKFQKNNVATKLEGPLNKELF